MDVMHRFAGSLLAGLLAVAAAAVAAQEEGAGEQTAAEPERLDTAVGARALFERDVVTTDEQLVGSVEDIVFDPAGRIELLVMKRADAGFTAIPWRFVKAPTSAKDKVQLSVKKQQVAGAPTFEADAAQSLGISQWRQVLVEYWGAPPVLTVVRQPAASFEVMDADGDGYVSRAEANAMASAYVYVPTQLGEQFNQVDRNGDGQISDAEFAAFEEEPGTTEQPEVPAQRSREGAAAEPPRPEPEAGAIRDNPRERPTR